MKNRKILVGALAIIVIATLTGCCKHEWKEATCIAPRTCSLCGKTDGETVDHIWVEAKCETPKTCSVCGSTEGSAPGHKFAEAGYLTPAVCIACGAEGETKPNYFEEKGLNLVDAVPETLEGPYIVYCLDNRMDYICRTNSASLNVNTLINGDGTKTIDIDYEIPLTCEYQYSTGKEYYSGEMESNLYDLYTGVGISEKATDGDAEYETTQTIDIDDNNILVKSQISILWGQSDWYSPSDDLDCIDLVCYKHYTVTVPEDYDGLVFGVKNFVKNKTEEEAVEEENSEETFYADSTGKFNTKEAGGTFVRVGL